MGIASTNRLYAFSPVAYFGVLAAGIVAMCCGFLLGGRVKANVFRNREEAVIFDITECGNSRSKFDAYVSSIREQIRKSQR